MAPDVPSLRTARAVAALVASCGVAAAAPAACGSSRSRPPARSGIAVTSAAFRSGGSIPLRYTCVGDNQSPPLAWSGVPAGAVQLAVVVEDPDAPQGTFVHWVLTGLAPTSAALAAGERPAGTTEARGSSGQVGYTGPCPPNHQTHRYRFTVYALRSPVAVPPGASPSDAVSAIRGGALGAGTLEARFGR
jgi:Raf kinase inhibitor-like YbhB/YbcL family protein